MKAPPIRFDADADVELPLQEKGDGLVSDLSDVSDEDTQGSCEDDLDVEEMEEEEQGAGNFDEGQGGVEEPERTGGLHAEQGGGQGGGGGGEGPAAASNNAGEALG